MTAKALWFYYRFPTVMILTMAIDIESRPSPTSVALSDVCTF